MLENMELLFFDTFSHETCSQRNLDLVQFPRPVYINEVRIIPLGARVQADFPGGVRLGATNPSEFKLDLFVNNLSKPGASTFEDLGSLEYKQNMNIQHVCNQKIPTDGLVLRGLYSALTVAVYGTVTKLVKERTPPPPPPPPQQQTTTGVPRLGEGRVERSGNHSGDSSLSSSIEWDRDLHPETDQHVPVVEPPLYSEATDHTQFNERNWVSSTSVDSQVHIAPQHSLPPGQTHLVPTLHSIPSTQSSQPAHPRNPPLKIPPRSDSFAKEHEGYERTSYPRESYDAKLQGSWEPKDKDDIRRDRDPRNHRERDRRDYRDFPDRDVDKVREVRDLAHRDRESLQEPDPHFHPDDQGDFHEPVDRERVQPKDGRYRGQEQLGLREPVREPVRMEGVKRPSTPPQMLSPKAKRPKTPPVLSDGDQKPPLVTIPQLPMVQTHSVVKGRGPLSPPAPKEEMEPGEVIEDRDDLFDQLTPDMSPEQNMDNLSDGEIHEGDQSEGYNEFLYEEILSEEEYMSDEEDRAMDMGDMEYELVDESWNYITSFNPYQCELTQLMYFTDPSLTLYEIEKKKMGCPPEESAMELAQKLMKTIDQFQDQEHTEKWVETIESIPSLIVPGLAILMQSPEIRAGILSTLLEWVNEALEFNKALEQTQAVYKVRHLKAGIRLVTALANCDDDILSHLLDQQVLHKLLDLYNQDYMALSIKLLILRALDALTHTKEGMESFLDSNPCRRRRRTLSKEPRKSTNGKIDVGKIQDRVPNGDEIVDVTIVSDNVVSKEMECQLTLEVDVNSETVSEEHMDVSVDDNLFLNSSTKNMYKVSAYERFVRLILTKQSTRAVVAISALLQKIHMYEVIKKFKVIVETIVEKYEKWVLENMSTLESESLSKLSSRYTESECSANVNEGEIVDPLMVQCSSMSEGDADTLISCLAEIKKVIVYAQQLIAQPRRSLPVQAQFEILENQNNAYPGLFSLLQSENFLECIFVILSCPVTSMHTGVFDSVKDILLQFIQTQHGLLFMSTQPEIMNGLIRMLIQLSDDRDENLDASHQLGMQLVYHLQAMQYVDGLEEFHNRDTGKRDVDDSDALNILQPLYTMIFVPIGRQAVVNVLSLEHNLDTLIPFIEMTGNEEYDMKLKKSASIGYATELLLTVVRYSENVLLWQNFAEKLLNFCSQVESSSKLQEVVQWLSVTRRISGYNAESVGSLCSIVKNCLEDTLAYPGELITAMRILKFLGVPPQSELKIEEQQEELRYKYVVVQLFANDGLSSFVTILQKICDEYQNPFQQSYAMIGPQWGMLLALVKPAVSLIKHTLSYLIFCRNTDFKDLTSISVLLRLYSLLSTLPQSSPWLSSASQVQNDIIDTLLSFTQPKFGTPDSEETLSKSLWTQMMNEVFKFVLTTPSNFFSGLLVIAELLPLPLPIQTKEALTPMDILQITNCRKLWGAHLHCLRNNIKDVIISLGGTTSQPLQHLLRRVCVQLADLAASTGLVVVTSLIDAMLECLMGCEETDDNEQVEPIKTSNSHMYRLLNMFSYLLSHPCIKMSTVQLLRRSTKLDEKYTDFILKLMNLLNQESDKPTQLQLQECIVTIIQSLCDSENGFLNSAQGAVSMEQLANSLPPKDHMIAVCNALVEHIGNMNFNFTTILPAIRTLLMIVENDFGFYCAKLALDKNPNALQSLLLKLSKSFSKDSADCMSTLNATMELIRMFLNADDSNQVSSTKTLLFTYQELSIYLGWNKEDCDVKHPLLELEKLLMENSREDDNIELQLIETISNLIQLLNNSSPKPDREFVEPVLPSSETLQNLFTARATFIIGEMDDGRFSPTYWLTQMDESDQEMETVSCDLEAMAVSFCPDLNLKLELGKEIVSKDLGSPIRNKRKGQTSLGKRKIPPLINPGQKDRPGKKPFIAPMRGRGFARGVIHASRNNDPFRSRPPNTSRPPSMHVDDFVALETFHPSIVPMGPTKRPNKESGRGRGRGSFESNRGFANVRGRFINSQSIVYNSRRDDKTRDYVSQGVIHSSVRGGSTSVWGTNRNIQSSSKGLVKSAPNTQRGFSRGSSEIRTPPNSTRSQEQYPGRFTRGARGGNTNHWSSAPRVKDRDVSRFSVSGGSGRGRRDVSRHVRALTR